jgi:hypothetical protein
MPVLRRLIATTAAVALMHAGLVHAAPQGLISAEQVAAVQASAPGAVSSGHAALYAQLDRAEVVQALRERGVSPEAARERVAALTDAEALQVAQHIDQAPAGGDVLGVIVFIFVLLLITDILGFTKVFPFTRSVR